MIVFCLDQFITDVTKFISGCMSSLSAMIQLELPHVNILSKMDLLQDKSNIDEYGLFLFPHCFFSFFFVEVSRLESIKLVWFYCELSSYLNPEPRTLLAELNQRMGPQFAKLNKSLIEMVRCGY